MRIWLHPARRAASRMTTQDVEAALRRQNVEVPAGRIESRMREFTVVSETDLRTPDQFEDIILGDAGGYLVRLKDVGRAVLGASYDRLIPRYNGRGGGALGLGWRSTARP